MCRGIVISYTSLVAQTVMRLLAMQETRVRPLGREDPLEKEMAMHSSTLAWKIPWTEEPGSYSPWGRKELDMTERLHFTSWCKVLSTLSLHVIQRPMSLLITHSSPLSYQKERPQALILGPSLNWLVL